MFFHPSLYPSIQASREAAADSNNQMAQAARIVGLKVQLEDARYSAMLYSAEVEEEIQELKQQAVRGDGRLRSRPSKDLHL